MHLAVYGSLKKGFHNHKYMDPRIFGFVGSFITAGRYHMVSAVGYPIVYKNPCTHNIEVEVYKLANGVDDLSQLDRLEGHPDHYRREPVLLGGGSPVAKAWMYLQERPPEQRMLYYQNVRYIGDKATWVRNHD